MRLKDLPGDESLSWKERFKLWKFKQFRMIKTPVIVTSKESISVESQAKDNILKIITESSDADEIHKAALQAGEMHMAEAVPALIALMKTSDDPIVWHGIGLAVYDLKDQRLLDPLVELIRDKKTERYRGTLVFGLEGLDCSSVIEWLVDLYDDDSYEVRMSVYGCIENIDMGKIDQKRIRACTEKLSVAKKVMTREDDIEDIDMLLELFKQ